MDTYEVILKFLTQHSLFHPYSASLFLNVSRIIIAKDRKSRMTLFFFTVSVKFFLQ